MDNLPDLPLHEQTKHITQEMADRIFDILCDKYPEQFQYINRVVKYGSLHPVEMQDSYMKVIQFICFGKINAFTPPSKEARDAFEPVPETELGLMDLTFEFWRRCRVESGYPEPVIRGKSLAPSPDGPFPDKLAAKPISRETEELGLTQEEVDRYVDQYYAENKEWCYIQGEAWRRDLVPFQLESGNGKSFIAFSAIYPEGEDDKIRHKKILRLCGEAAERVRISRKYYTLEQLYNFWNITPK